MFIPPTKFALKLPHMSVQKSLARPLFFQQKLVSKRGCRAPVFRDYSRHHLFMDEHLLLEWNASPTGPVLIRFRCQTWLCCRKVQQSGQIPGFTWRWRPRSPFPHNQHSYLFTTDLGKNDRSSLLIPSTRFIPWSWFDRPASMSSHTHPFSQILEEDFDLLWPFEVCHLNLTLCNFGSCVHRTPYDFRGIKWTASLVIHFDRLSCFMTRNRVYCT